MSEEILPNNEKGLAKEIETLPPEEQARKIQSIFMSMIQSGRKSDKSVLFEKMSPENISKYLDGMEKNDERKFKDEQNKRFLYMVYVFIGLIAFGIGVVYLLPKDKDLLLQLIAILVSFGGGFGIGRAYGNDKDNE